MWYNIRTTEMFLYSFKILKWKNTNDSTYYKPIIQTKFRYFFKLQQML